MKAVLGFFRASEFKVSDGFGPGGIVGTSQGFLVVLLMDKILHDPKDPKLWELWYIPYNWVMQDFVHQPYKVYSFPLRC